MQSEKLTCHEKIQEILQGFCTGAEVIVHTVKESACGLPQITEVEFRRGGNFIILAVASTYSNTLLAKVPPTPKLVSKTRVTGTVGGVEVAKTFGEDEYQAREDFFHGLVNAKREDIEEPEA